MALSLKAQDILWDINRKTLAEADRLGLKYGDGIEPLAHIDVLQAFAKGIALEELKTASVKLTYAKGDDDWQATCIAINASFDANSYLTSRAIVSAFSSMLKL